MAIEISLTFDGPHAAVDAEVALRAVPPNCVERVVLSRAHAVNTDVLHAFERSVARSSRASAVEDNRSAPLRNAPPVEYAVFSLEKLRDFRGRLHPDNGVVLDELVRRGGSADYYDLLAARQRSSPGRKDLKGIGGINASARTLLRTENFLSWKVTRYELGRPRGWEYSIPGAAVSGLAEILREAEVGDRTS